MALAALPGFRDFYPDAFAARQHVMSTWRTVAGRSGFVEYDGPPLEPLELYTRKSGDEIVGQLYTFVDKGDRAVALRPEMTPTFARMVAVQANALRQPVRWFSIPQLFRYERQQRGRLREHFQLNVDIVGERDVTADAELLAVAIDIMRDLGLTPQDVVARVGDRRLLAAYLVSAGVAEKDHPAVFAVVDKLERVPPAVSATRLRDLGLSTAASDAVLAIPGLSLAALRPRLADDAARCADDFARYLEYLAALGVGEWVRVDLSIVRGLAYYTGIVFELFDAQGELRAICGGGRYDGLLEASGGPALPAVGFGMGDVVLGELLKARGKLPAPAAGLDYWVTAQEDRYFGADAGVTLMDVMRTAASLRRTGRSVEYALRPQAFGKQLKAAAAAGARSLLVLTPNFPETGEIQLRPMVRTPGAEPRGLTLSELLHELRGAASRD